MIGGALQENILILLVWDKNHARIIRGIVDVALFGGPYRLLVTRIFDYIDKFKKPPGDHLPDLVTDKLEGENKREGALYAEIIEHLYAAKDGVNATYVMSQLEIFVKRQSLRSIAVDLAKALQRDTEASLEEAEQLLARANKATLSVFDPGVRLSDKKRALEFLDSSTTGCPTGIPELDKRGFGPTRKELWLLIANTKKGKSWGLMHLGKMALMSRVKVLHITLEMSESRCAQRYYQALFAISKRKETFQTTKFKRDDLGRIEGFDDVRITPRLSFDDPSIRRKLEGKIDKWALRLLDNILIKQFPTGSLTVRQLTAYLDNLEATERFVPDLLLLDYPDLMKVPSDNYRLGLDEIYKDLRGLAVSRNFALAVVSQSHRAAAKSKQVGAENVAESYAKIANADTIITLSSTEQEAKLGLARLHVAAGRNDADGCTIVISQNYGTGNFVFDSSLMVGNYWQQLPQEEQI